GRQPLGAGGEGHRADPHRDARRHGGREGAGALEGRRCFGEYCDPRCVQKRGLTRPARLVHLCSQIRSTHSFSGGSLERTGRRTKTFRPSFSTSTSAMVKYHPFLGPFATRMTAFFPSESSPLDGTAMLHSVPWPGQNLRTTALLSPVRS